jgi:hypothetical protein
MQLGWIDFSKNERNKVTSILRLLGTQTAVDELGIGTVRDGFSSLLFPGISVLHTRAKYFVLIPYLFADAEKQSFSRVSEMKTWLNKQEEKLTKTLVENSEPKTDGIIGSRNYKQGKTLKMKPSSMYWNGLRVTGILHQPELSLDDVCEIAYLRGKKQSEISLKAEGNDVSGDDKDALNDGQVLFYPILSDYDYMTQAEIALTVRESAYLLDRFTHCKGTEASLMAYMLENKLLYDSFEEIDVSGLPERLAYIVSLAKDFADFIYGAHLLYNLIYSEGTEMADEFAAWKESDYRAVNLEEIILVSHCPEHTGSFLRQFDQSIQNNDIEAAKSLIITREKYIKKDRAKLCRPEQYRYENPVHNYKLDYRYNTAAVIMKDIYIGLGGYNAQADV